MGQRYTPKFRVRGSRSSPNTNNKFGAVKVSGYDSKKELKRHHTLSLLESAGEISELKTQVWFVLIPKQDGERQCRYRADFTYKNKNGALVVEDTKGYRTQEYIIKRKLMLFVHGIKIIET